MLVDTHAHLFFENYQGEVGEIVARASAAQVKKIIVPGVDVASSQQAVKLAKQYPEIIYAAVGIHPEEVGVDLEEQMIKVRKLLDANRAQIVAVGEVGIDLNTELLRAKLTKQQELLRLQCLLAKEYDLPVIVHTRLSVGEAIAVLEEVKIRKALFHCFSGTSEELQKVLDKGYYVSIGGNVSWSKRVKGLAKLVPIDRLLLETDSPFMTPRNANGEKISLSNEPANVKILAEIIAGERGVTLGKLGERTTKNVEELFGI